MCRQARCLYIKVLQTFRLRDARFSIDMQVLTDLKRCPFLSHPPGSSSQPWHRHLPSPSNRVNRENLANPVNLENPAHFLLLS